MKANNNAVRLTKHQKYLLDYIENNFNDSKEYYYCECSSDCSKPWNARTVFSLIEKGLVKLVEGGDMVYDTYGVYFLTLTKNKKQEHREEQLKELLDKTT